MKTLAMLFVSVFFLAACGGGQERIRPYQADIAGVDKADIRACERKAIEKAPSDWYAEGVPYGHIGPYTHIGPYSRVKGPTEGSYLQKRKELLEDCVIDRSRIDESS